jgi:hypothetical protein
VAHALVTIFAVGVKGVTDKRTSPLNIPAVEPPNRPPDSSVEQRTSPDQVRKRMHMLHATLVQEVLSLHLKQDTECPDLGLLWFSSVPPGRWLR